MDLRGAHVLVTGASGGIGVALTMALAARGATLTLTGRRRDVLTTLAERVGGTAIVADLAGRATGPLPSIPDPVRTRSPSLEAIRHAERLPSDLAPDERRAQVDAIFADAPDGTRFSPFTPAEERRLQEAYADDMVRIAALDPSILMRF